MPDNPRIEDLRRRVAADPASIAFAALAEEYRRSGAYPQAIETCRTGLQRHPSYLSARVTLGRALIEVGEYGEARKELETVLQAAPENLAAIRAMAEIHARTDQPVERASPRAAAEPSPQAAVADWQLPPAPPPSVPPPPPSKPTPIAVAAPIPVAPAPVVAIAPAAVEAPPAAPEIDGRRVALVARLEALLASIQARRAELRVG